MTALLFAGCLFLAYGPAFIIMLSVIAPRSYLFILLTLRYPRALGGISWPKILCCY